MTIMLTAAGSRSRKSFECCQRAEMRRQIVQGSESARWRQYQCFVLDVIKSLYLSIGQLAGVFPWVTYGENCIILTLTVFDWSTPPFSRAQLEASSRSSEQPTDRPAPKGQQWHTTNLPVEKIHHAWSYGSDATVLDDYAFTTMTRVTDGQTDRQAGDIIYRAKHICYYAVAC